MKSVGDAIKLFGAQNRPVGSHQFSNHGLVAAKGNLRCDDDGEEDKTHYCQDGFKDTSQIVTVDVSQSVAIPFTPLPSMHKCSLARVTTEEARGGRQGTEERRMMERRKVSGSSPTLPPHLPRRQVDDGSGGVRVGPGRDTVDDIVRPASSPRLQR